MPVSIGWSHANKRRNLGAAALNLQKKNLNRTFMFLTRFLGDMSDEQLLKEKRFVVNENIEVD